MRLLTAAVLVLPAAALAQDSIWVNYESDGALEATGFASSAVRMPESLRIAADDFEIGPPPPPRSPRSCSTRCGSTRR